MQRPFFVCVERGYDGDGGIARNHGPAHGAEQARLSPEAWDRRCVSSCHLTVASTTTYQGKVMRRPIRFVLYAASVFSLAASLLPAQISADNGADAGRRQMDDYLDGIARSART